MHTMLSASSLLVLLPILSVSADMTVTLPIFNADPQSLVASVVGADATATTLQLNCAGDIPDVECGFPSATPATITAGPSTYRAGYTTVFQDDGASAPTTQKIDAGCDIADQTAAVCVATVDAGVADAALITTTTLGLEDFKYLEIVITAGAEKLAVGENGAPFTAPASVLSSAAAAAAEGAAATAPASGAAATGASALNGAVPSVAVGNAEGSSAQGGNAPSSGNSGNANVANSVQASSSLSASIAAVTSSGTLSTVSGSSGSSRTTSASILLATTNAAPGNAAQAGGALLGLAVAVLAVL